MAEITASLVKELRVVSGAGMMDCKKALIETGGDMEEAQDWLRKKGLASAAKKAGRVAAEGLIGIAVDGTRGAVVELNSETDFVARNDDFQGFVGQLAGLALDAGGSVEALSASQVPDAGLSVADALTRLISKIGENMNLRRTAAVSVDQGAVGAYVHNQAAPGLGKIGVLVALESSGDPAALATLGKQLAMHVAAAAPQAIDASGVDASALERERNILADQARASGKPEEIVQKMVEGRLRKFYEEVCLLEQTFVIDGETKVGKVLEQEGEKLGAPDQGGTDGALPAGRGHRASGKRFRRGGGRATQVAPYRPGSSTKNPRRTIESAQPRSGRSLVTQSGRHMAEVARELSVKYGRALLKISGEALMGEGDYGLEPKTVSRIAGEIAQVHGMGIELCLVIGGGNIFRGLAGAAAGMERTTADHMGMLATVINSLAMQGALEDLDIPTRVQTAIPMAAVAEPYIRRRAVRHMEKGRVVIFAGGTGNPYFTTDTTAALRAAEMGCDALLKGTKVDGVYDDDPLKNPSARRYERLTYRQVQTEELGVMDPEAISLARKEHIPILVFSIVKPGNFAEVLCGGGRYTIVEDEDRENGD